MTSSENDENPRQEALEESLERFQLAMQCAEEGLWSWNPLSDQIFLSPPYKAILGYADHELGNHHQIFEERVHPEDLARIKQAMGDFVAGRGDTYLEIFRMRHRDGHYRWIRSRAVAARQANGQARLVVGTHVDITVQQNALSALQDQEVLLRQVIDHLPQFIFWKDTRSIYRGCNAAYPAFVGKHDTSEIIGKDDYALFGGTEAELFRQDDQTIFQENRPRYRFLEAVVKDGQRRWMETSKIPLHDHRGQVVGLLGITEDVTEREETTRLREAYNQELTREVAERTEALSRARDEADQARRGAELANQAKSRFLATMSHELRTPLNGILGYAQILQRDRNLDSRQLGGIDTIRRSGDHLLTLINDVLDLARIESERVELAPVDFSLPEFLQGVADLFRMRAEQKGIGFDFQIRSPLPQGVHCDEKRLRQILLNLLSNAVKFTEQGAVSLHVGHHHGGIRFQVEDSGVGIAADELAHIFEPFRQVGEHHRRAEGTGLGLAITQHLVRVLGGEIQVESAPGQGSRFWFALNLPEVDLRSAKQPAITQQIHGYHGPRRRLLVVDQGADDRAMLRSFLEPLGFSLNEALDGQQALATARQQAPDLILTEMTLPAPGGYALVEQIRQTPELATIPLIAVSASVFEHHREAALVAGCDAFLTKPVDLQDLLACLAKQLTLRWQQHPTADDAFPVQGDQSGQDAPLSASERQTLGELALSGDIEAINAFLEAHANDPRRILSEIRQLNEDFQVDEIIKLLQAHSDCA